MTRADWFRLAGFGAAVALLHVVGWGLFAWYAHNSPALAGLGTLAYTFGLRHAFDADHIAAIDNVTRKFREDGRRSLGVGFFFSLGHSSVVLALSTAVALGAATAKSSIPSFQHWGGYVGAGVSGTFLWLIGILNLLVLLDIVRIYRSGGDDARLEQRLLDRGLISRLCLGRVAGRIRSSRQMYPLGFLFGLGFDTASEIALLGISAGVAAQHVPFLALLSLPVLFAAGMSLMDTADGAFMATAYGWAFSSPARKVFYNLTVTSLSVTVALGIGTVELLQVVGLNTIDTSRMGYAIVALFALAWLTAAIASRASGARPRGDFLQS